MAEGSFGNLQDMEPDTSPRTTRIPTVPPGGTVSASQIAPPETGYVSPVRLRAEGQDDDSPHDSDLPTGAAEGEPGADPLPQPRIDAGKQPLVLIVEDTTELAEVIQATLERMGMAAVYETHGSRALAKLNDIDPDVVLLDISLPDTTGWKILDAIKERAVQRQRMPVVIVITAHDDPANRLVGKLQNVYSYLVKPFTSDSIERVVAEAVENARR